MKPLALAFLALAACHETSTYVMDFDGSTDTERVNVIRGTPADDVLIGGPGDDLINGGAGNDLICGGPCDPAIVDRYRNKEGW